MATIIIYFKNRVLLSIIEKIDNKINEYAIVLNRLIKAKRFNNGRTKTKLIMLNSKKVLFGILLNIAIILYGLYKQI
jgi:hypothetical protein